MTKVLGLQDGPEVNEAVRRVLYPKTAASISVSHFLELSFGLQHCIVNGRPLHHSFARYLGVGNTLTCFHYEEVHPNVVLMPAPKISYSQQILTEWLEEEAELLIEVENFTLRHLTAFNNRTVVGRENWPTESRASALSTCKSGDTLDLCD